MIYPSTKCVSSPESSSLSLRPAVNVEDVDSEHEKGGEGGAAGEEQSNLPKILPPQDPKLTTLTVPVTPSGGRQRYEILLLFYREVYVVYLVNTSRGSCCKYIQGLSLSIDSSFRLYITPLSIFSSPLMRSSTVKEIKSKKTAWIG